VLPSALRAPGIASAFGMSPGAMSFVGVFLAASDHLSDVLPTDAGRSRDSREGFACLLGAENLGAEMVSRCIRLLLRLLQRQGGGSYAIKRARHV
jgi:hypothetical protein